MVLPAALAFKLGLLTVGYSMWSGVAVWSRSSQDGVIAWLLAALFAAATTWWLSRDRRAVVMTQLGHAVAFLSLGFLLPFLVAFIIFVPANVIATVNSQLGTAIASLSFLISTTGQVWTIVFAFLLLPLGLVGIWLGRFRTLAALCVLTGLWALPSIVTFLTDRDVTFEFLSYDAALTVGLAVLTIHAWRRNRHEDLRRPVTLALVVSTIAAYTDVTIAAYQTAQSFACLLLLPVGYQLLFDSHDLNHTSRKEPYAVVHTLALQTTLLLLIAWAVVTRQVTYQANTFEDVASRIFLPPLVALTLATSLTPSAESSRHLEVESSGSVSA